MAALDDIVQMQMIIHELMESNNRETVAASDNLTDLAQLDVSLRSRQEEYALFARSLPTTTIRMNDNSDLVKVNEELIKAISETNMMKSDGEDVASMKESIIKMEQQIKTLIHENNLLCDRCKVSADNLKKSEGEKLKLEAKNNELSKQIKSFYDSVQGTKKHIATIMGDNDKLAKRVGHIELESKQKAEQLMLQLKAEVSLRKAAEKDAMEAQTHVVALERRVKEVVGETTELKALVHELKGGVGVLNTIARIRNVEGNVKTVGFDSMMKRIDGIKQRVEQRTTQ